MTLEECLSLTVETYLESRGTLCTEVGMDRVLDRILSVSYLEVTYGTSSCSLYSFKGHLFFLT